MFHEQVCFLQKTSKEEWHKSSTSPHTTVSSFRDNLFQFRHPPGQLIPHPGHKRTIHTMNGSEFSNWAWRIPRPLSANNLVAAAVSPVDMPLFCWSAACNFSSKDKDSLLHHYCVCGKRTTSIAFLLLGSQRDAASKVEPSCNSKGSRTVFVFLLSLSRSLTSRHVTWDVMCVLFTGDRSFHQLCSFCTLLELHAGNTW